MFCVELTHRLCRVQSDSWSAKKKKSAQSRSINQTHQLSLKMQEQINHSSKIYILGFDYRCSLLSFILKLCVYIHATKWAAGSDAWFLKILNCFSPFNSFSSAVILPCGADQSDWQLLSCLNTPGQMLAPCSKWNETFQGQIYAMTKGSEQRSSADVPIVTREIAHLKLPEQQPRRVYPWGSETSPGPVCLIQYVRRSVFWFWSYETCKLAGLLITETALI